MYTDNDKLQKRFQGKMVGSKGVGYAEVFTNKEVEEFLKENKPSKFVIYTDGSSRGNPGPGGWGAIIIQNDNRGIMNNESRIMELGGAEKESTNNRMEMRAVIEGLKNTPENSNVEIHADSEYVIKGATIWMKNWQKNNWWTKDKREVMNRDLWEEMLEELGKRNVIWKKVVGHSGHEWNDRCDEIATSFADGKPVSLENDSML